MVSGFAPTRCLAFVSMWLVCIWNGGVATPTRILHSQERKLLDIRFLRDVDSADARKAWRDAFDQNCRAPCYLDPYDLQRFLAAVLSTHKGDDSTLLFTSEGVHVTINGWPLGDIADPHFAELMLATFIGSVPPTPRLNASYLVSWTDAVTSTASNRPRLG